MGWRFTTDVETYAASAWDLLAHNPVEHTVALSVIESVRAGHRWSEHGQIWFAYYDDGAVRGAVSLTPPFELLLSAVPEDTLAELIDALLREGVSFPGVNGVTDTVERFVATWTNATGARPVPVRQMRLYRLGTLRPPAPAPAGRARPAGLDDLETAVRWLRDFQTEGDVPATNLESAVRSAIGGDASVSGKTTRDPLSRSRAGRRLPWASLASPRSTPRPRLHGDPLRRAMMALPSPEESR